MNTEDHYYTTLYAFKLDVFIIEGTFKILIHNVPGEAPHYYIRYIDQEKGPMGKYLGHGEQHFKRMFGGREMLYRPAKRHEIAKAFLLGLK